MSMNKGEVNTLLQNVVSEFSRRLTLVEMTIHDFLQMEGKEKDFKAFIDSKYGKKDTVSKIIQKGESPPNKVEK
jgi:hypothetical protein